MTDEFRRHVVETAGVACMRVPPLWPLKNFVAVNPFMGLADLNFSAACVSMRRVAHADILSPLEFYRAQFESGRIETADMQRAIDESGPVLMESLGEIEAKRVNLSYLETVLRYGTATLRDSLPAGAVLSVAGLLDRRRGTKWQRLVTEECSKWCAAYYDDGQSAWRMPWRSLSLYAAWKHAAQIDLNLELEGMQGFRAHVAKLPDDPRDCIVAVVSRLGIPAAALEEFLHHQFMSIAGWSGYVRYRVRENGLYGTSDDSLLELLAIRLAYDDALYAMHGEPEFQAAWRNQQARVLETNKPPAQLDPVLLDIIARYLLQLALERRFQRQLVGRLSAVNQEQAPKGRADSPRRAVQAAFCIDVRSEIYRRHFEAASPEVETIGFAGFFAFFIEYIPLGLDRGTAQCPVLFTPKFRVRETVKNAGPEEVDQILANRVRNKRVSQAWRSFKGSAVSCFPFVETLGMLFGVKLITDSFGWTRTVAKPSVDGFPAAVVKRTAPEIAFQGRTLGSGEAPVETGIVTSAQIDAAATALGAMALTSDFARLVMLCGHGSATVNNPYASALDCGACGGHTGEANVRVGAAIFNHPDVRAGLAQRGIQIPEDTWFIGALHDTCTDDVRIFDEELIPTTHRDDLRQLRSWLAHAAREARKERAHSLGLGAEPPAAIDQLVRERGRDWAQVRPEWALANNAAFIAAPRERTKQLNLGGRCFLHNYHFEADPQKAVLELIMIAPMVVASWINLQYYASTVNNGRFGSGNKVLHNVVGTLGVLEGNGGDLRVGLPLQSVHDGVNPAHEPLRLNVFIEAPSEEMDRIISKHQHVRDLLENGWVHLFCIADAGKSYLRRAEGGIWEAFPAD